MDSVTFVTYRSKENIHHNFHISLNSRTVDWPPEFPTFRSAENGQIRCILTLKSGFSEVDGQLTVLYWLQFS